MRPLRRGPADDRRDLTIARWLTLLFGVLATGVAFYVSHFEHIIKAYTTIISLFSGPVLALFLLGIFSRRARFSSWAVGCVLSIPATLLIQHVVKVHWVYYFPFSFGVTFLAGLIASRFVAARPVDPSLTMRGRIALREIE